MHRRQVLAGGGALLSAAIAGCGHPPVVLDMDSATAADISDEMSMTADLGSEEYALVTAARENGSATRTGRRELFDRIDVVRADDAFYEVSETRLERNDVTVYEVRVDIDPEDSTPDLGEIAYDDLPEIDRQRLEPVLSAVNPPEHEQSAYDIGIEYGTGDEVGNGSVFVPDPQYDIVRRGEDRYRIAVDSRTATEAEYRYEVTELAPDVATFAAQIRAQYLFTLTDLSDAERAVIEKAIDEGYFEDDDAFRSVIDRIRDHEGLDVDDFYGTWLVAYEGEEYLTYAEW